MYNTNNTILMNKLYITMKHNVISKLYITMKHNVLAMNHND